MSAPVSGSFLSYEKIVIYRSVKKLGDSVKNPLLT